MECVDSMGGVIKRVEWIKGNSKMKKEKGRAES